MKMMKNMVFAIDWDGTIVPDGCYPKTGEPKPNAINVIERLINDGHKIIIWTCRGGMEQTECIRAKLNEYGIFDFIINEHLQETLDAFEHSSPKVFADVYIDDRGIHTKEIDWFEIEEIIFSKSIDKSIK